MWLTGNIPYYGRLGHSSQQMGCCLVAAPNIEYKERTSLKWNYEQWSVSPRVLQRPRRKKMACCSTIYQRITLQPTINFFLDCMPCAQVWASRPAMQKKIRKERNIKFSRIIYSLKHCSVLPLDKNGDKEQKIGLKDAMRQMFDGTRDYRWCV